MNQYLRAQWDRALGIALIAAGGIAIALGYLGIRNSGFVAEQLAYLASGGLGGLWLVGVGATLLVNANLTDEWRKLDEIRDLLAANLPTADSPSSLRPNGRKDDGESPMGAERGAAEVRVLLGAAGAATAVSALLVAAGWYRAENATTAQAALDATVIGVLGLVVLGSGAGAAGIRARTLLRSRLGATTAGVRVVDLDPAGPPGPAPQNGSRAGLAWHRNGRWFHDPSCAMARDAKASTREPPSRLGPCPLCMGGLVGQR